MMNWVRQAQQAAQREDWAELAQCVQKALLSDGSLELAPNDRQDLGLFAIALLRSGDFQDRWDIAKVFSRLGESAIPPLIALLQDEDASVDARWFAGRVLGDLNHPAAIYALVECLQNTDDDELSEMAADALATLGEAAIDALVALLPDPATRSLAVQSLAQIRRSSTIAPLLSVVDDPQPEIRAGAIAALSSFHDPRIPPVLINALRDTSVPVRRAAVIGLGVRTDQVVELNLVPLLGDRLWDLNLGICQQAALALGRLGAKSADHAAVQILLKALRSPQTAETLQTEIIRALGWIGTQSALDGLEQLCSDPLSPSLYAEIVAAIGRWTAPELQPAAARILIDQLSATERSPSAQQAIAAALGQLQQPIALEALVQLLAEDKAGVRLHAIAALKRLPGDIAKQRLETLQVSPNLPESLHRGVAIALSEWQLELPQ